MIDRDLAETLVALALILACAMTAIATAQPPRKERSPRHARKGRRKPRHQVTAPGSSTVDPATASALVEIAVEATAASTPTPTGRPRPRILTGEPAAPEPPRPAARRAITLVAGITALAAGGAVGLLVLVRALVAMFKKIGG